MDKRSLVFLVALAVVSLCVLLAVAASPWPDEPPLSFNVANPPPSLLNAPPQSAPLPSTGRLLIPPVGAANRAMGLGPFGIDRAGPAGVWWHIGSLAALLVLAALVLALMPRRVNVLAEVISGDWGQRFLAVVIGLLGYLAAGLLAFVLFVNVVGAPLVAILILGVYVATAIGLAAVALAAGRALCHALRLAPHGPIFHLGTGIVVLFVLTIVPYVGWIVAAIAALLGFGAFLWTRGGDTARWSLDELVE